MFILSNFLSSFPFLAVMSIATASITYYMVEFHSQFPRFVFMCLDLLSAIAAVESSMMIIASLVPNYLMGVIVGAGYLVRTTAYNFCRASLIHLHLSILKVLFITNYHAYLGNHDDDCRIFPLAS